VSAIDLFAEGTPADAAEALAAARAALATGRDLSFHVDPENVGLLPRVLRERLPTSCADRAPVVTAVLRAVDEAPDRTLVAHEGTLAPALRRLHAEGLPLRLSTGRPYVLPPPALDISTNDLCGLECVMCKNRAPRRDPLSMSPADVRALFAQAAEWGVPKVALTGAGEPFRDPEMLAYVRDANALGLRVALTSNGFPISEAIAAELAAGMVSVSISIHGATTATHDAIVGVPKAADNAFRAVKRLLAARDAGRSKLTINISTVIQRANIGEIAALARWAREAGCNGFNIQPVNLQHGSIDGERIKRRDDVQLLATLWPTPADADALAVMARELAEIRREHPRFLNTTEERLELFQRYFEDSSRAALAVTCKVGENFLAIDHRGSIKPCYRLPWSHGDARLVDVRALWNSEAYARTRAMIEACPLTCMNNCFFRRSKQSATPARAG
jgi:MoaA/NifB/PqqE/SkfB family radical SAM enzyme